MTLDVEDDATLLSAARLVADGAAVEDVARLDPSPVVAVEMKTIAQLASFCRRQLVDVPVPAAWQDASAARLVAAIAAAALVKVAASMVMALAAPAAVNTPRPGTPAASFPLAIVGARVLFCGIGVLLVQGSRRDRRALDLGCFFLLIAASLSTGTVPGSLHAGPAQAATWLTAIQPEAFLSYVWWRFIQRFPRCASDRG